MPRYNLSPYEGAMSFLADMQLKPYWDTVEEKGQPVLFRKIPGSKGRYRVTKQRKEQRWPKLIDTLRLNTKEDVARVRSEVLIRMKIS